MKHLPGSIKRVRFRTEKAIVGQRNAAKSAVDDIISAIFTGNFAHEGGREPVLASRLHGRGFRSLEAAPSRT